MRSTSTTYNAHDYTYIVWDNALASLLDSTGSEVMEYQAPNTMDEYGYFIINGEVVDSHHENDYEVDCRLLAAIYEANQ